MTQAQEIGQLKLQVAQLTLLSRQLLEGKFTGADGAAGTLVALEGGATSVDVYPFAAEGEEAQPS